MALREDFTDDEWFMLISTPAMIGASVASAGQSGPFGTAKEVLASLKSVATASQDYPDNSLIQELTKRIEDRDAAREQVTQYRDKTLEKLDGKDQADLQAETLEDARKTSALLASKVSPEEAREYKAWAMTLAENVAKAAKEGSFLGFGGEQVSPEEKEMLAQIDAALNV